MEQAPLDVTILQLDEAKAAYIAAAHDVRVLDVYEVWLLRPRYFVKTSGKAHRP